MKGRLRFSISVGEALVCLVGAFAAGFSWFAASPISALAIALATLLLVDSSRTHRDGWTNIAAVLAIAMVFGPIPAIAVDVAFVLAFSPRKIALVAVAPLTLSFAGPAWMVAIGAGTAVAIRFALTEADWADGAAAIGLVVFGAVGTNPICLAMACAGTVLVARAVRHATAIADHDQELRDVFLGMLRRSHPYTRGHAHRVAMLARAVGRRFGFSRRRLARLEFAAVLHDIGKVTIDEEVLDLPRRLSTMEMEHVRDHSANGADILAALAGLEQTAYWIRCHHERIDGRGYPSGLQPDRTPIESRMIAVIDAYDAMTGGDSPEERRTYREPMTSEAAIAELEKHAGGQFDADVVRAFRSVIAEVAA